MTQKSTFYFGADIQGRSIVSDAQFSTFCRDVIVPLFDGFTVQHGTGFWQGKPEPVRLLTILDTADQGAGWFRLAGEAIARAYCNRFEQGCVLVETSTVGAAFVEGSDS